VNEKTKIETMPLPFGQEWELFADANVIVLSPELDARGRQRALDEIQSHWRRHSMHVVHSNEPQPVVYPQTQPMRAVSQIAR
jgi:hypothetical protein